MTNQETAPTNQQPGAGNTMEISAVGPSANGQQQECGKNGAAHRLRGGGAGKDCFLTIFACFLCFECCEGCCDIIGDIICCPCEICC